MCLDHMFVIQSSNANNLKYNSYILDTQITDHCPIMLQIFNEHGQNNFMSEHSKYTKDITELNKLKNCNRTKSGDIF